ncbi:protein of unknown function [Vibrio tapetis subsp. tapetis]|uniref:Uncharacterized protein n=1 Tax=Vibrio tapetis subsp. tapetis TaxID=1671868 RepID=A0A2N8ZJ23_9VIBR|nr:protein of unknown function [Vibrio tapetis subsp. tapetis]
MKIIANKAEFFCFCRQSKQANRMTRKTKTKKPQTDQSIWGKGYLKYEKTIDASLLASQRSLLKITFRIPCRLRISCWKTEA